MSTVRARVGVVALAVVLAGCSGGGDGASVDSTTAASTTSSAATTVASSTTAAPTTTAAGAVTTAPPTTAAVTTTTAPVDISSLADSEGRVDVQWLEGGIRLLRRFDGADGAITAAVVQADGAVVAVPASVGVVEEATAGPTGLVVSTRGGEVKRYDGATREWVTVPFDLPPNWRVSFVPAGAVTLLVSWDLGAAIDTGRGPTRLAQLHADGTVTPAALPDDPWAVPAPGSLTVWTGTDLVVYGVDSAAFTGGLRHVTAYDVAADRWRPLSDPPGLDCVSEPCTWSAPHEFGYGHAVEWLGARTFVHTFVGRNEVTALHDPATDTWDVLPAPPVDLVNPWAEKVGANVVVFSTAKFDTTRGFGQVATLDVAARTWSTARLVPEDAVGADFSSTLCPTSMPDLGVTVVGRCRYPDVAEPAVAIDQRTGAWAAVTPDQAQAWKRRQTPQLLTEVLADR